MDSNRLHPGRQVSVGSTSIKYNFNNLNPSSDFKFITHRFLPTKASRNRSELEANRSIRTVQVFPAETQTTMRQYLLLLEGHTQTR